MYYSIWIVILTLIAMPLDSVMQKEQDIQAIEQLMGSEWSCGEKSHFVFTLKLGIERNDLWRFDPDGLWFLISPYIEVRHKELAELYRSIDKNRKKKAYKAFHPDMITVIQYDFIRRSMAKVSGYHTRKTIISASNEFVNDFQNLCASELEEILSIEDFYNWGRANNVFYGYIGPRTEMLLARSFMPIELFKRQYENVKDIHRDFYEQLLEIK